ncbi:LOW QUALITY PROTEIN: hypothetical protein IFM46972_02231 [Aspergillus udagawae]|uniref:Uncharacterized protein n=1 Tax=Aspergillus udagawae TaxID=91492 RepID=A0A8H3NAB6_9EURO|nr:LOW QUALITY PROTEIN: hypothetical protein IFM46972_02231 [Aspergillus udagawae]
MLAPAASTKFPATSTSTIISCPQSNKQDNSRSYTLLTKEEVQIGNTVEKNAVIKKVWNCNARRAGLFGIKVDNHIFEHGRKK